MVVDLGGSERPGATPFKESTKIALYRPAIHTVIQDLSDPVRIISRKTVVPTQRRTTAFGASYSRCSHVPTFDTESQR